MSTFPERLTLAADRMGAISTTERVKAVATAANVSNSTARRWLRGECRPRFASTMLQLADGMNADFGWLWSGKSTHETDYLRLDDIEPWAANKFRRMHIRLMNNDSKAIRMLGSFWDGNIPIEALLQAM